MKKLILILICGLVSVSAFAQVSSQTSIKFTPLFSGYNVQLLTNVPVSIGYSNVLYTAYNGQVLYSYSNNVVNGVAVSNAAPDAFQPVGLVADVNGDVNANTTLWLFIGNTNLIPIPITNLIGQWFVPTLPNTTNFSTTAWATMWPLAPSSGGPSWMFPATTNYYGTYVPTVTNNVFVKLYAAPVGSLIIGGGMSTPPSSNIWESSASFSCTFTSVGGSIPQTFRTNLPTGFLQGVRWTRVELSTTTNGWSSSSANILVNQVGISQLIP